MSHYDDCGCPRCDSPLSAADRTTARGPCPYAGEDGYCSCRRCEDPGPDPAPEAEPEPEEGDR